MGSPIFAKSNLVLHACHVLGEGGNEAKKEEEAAEMLILGDLFGDRIGTVGLERVRSDNRFLGVEMREVGDVIGEVEAGCLN